MNVATAATMTARTLTLAVGMSAPLVNAVDPLRREVADEHLPGRPSAILRPAALLIHPRRSLEHVYPASLREPREEVAEREHEPHRTRVHDHFGQIMLDRSHHRACDVLGLGSPEPARGGEVCRVLERAVHAGVGDEPGADGRGAHALVAVGGAQRSRERDERGLRGCVGFGETWGNPSGERAEVHYVAPLALEHARQDERRENERGDEVHLGGVLDLFRARAMEALREHDARVVDQHIHRAELTLGGLDESLAIPRASQVGRHGQGLDVALAELRREGIELGCRARGEHEVHALRGQRASDVPPYPMRRACDERGAARKMTHDTGELRAKTARRNRPRRRQPNTSSATSTRPNGALTCTPCTARFTCWNISRAIFTPPPSPAPLPFSCPCRIRASTDSCTVTPGTSFARNSAFRSEMSGQIPATIGILNCSARFRNVSSCAGSNTGCVTAKSAPASTFQANRDSSRSRSPAPGFTPTPIVHCVGAPIGLLPGSSPWFRRNTRFVSPIESMSNTAVASG